MGTCSSTFIARFKMSRVTLLRVKHDRSKHFDKYHVWVGDNLVMVVMGMVMTTWWRVGDDDGGQTQAELPQTPLLRLRSSSRGAAENFNLEREK